MAERGTVGKEEEEEEEEDAPIEVKELINDNVIRVKDFENGRCLTIPVGDRSCVITYDRSGGWKFSFSNAKFTQNNYGPKFVDLRIENGPRSFIVKRIDDDVAILTSHFSADGKVWSSNCGGGGRTSCQMMEFY